MERCPAMARGGLGAGEPLYSPQLCSRCPWPGSLPVGTPPQGSSPLTLCSASWHLISSWLVAVSCGASRACSASSIQSRSSRRDSLNCSRERGLVQGAQRRGTAPRSHGQRGTAPCRARALAPPAGYLLGALASLLQSRPALRRVLQHLAQPLLGRQHEVLDHGSVLLPAEVLQARRHGLQAAQLFPVGICLLHQGLRAARRGWGAWAAPGQEQAPKPQGRPSLGGALGVAQGDFP